MNPQENNVPTPPDFDVDIYGQRFSYRNNSKLKRKETAFPFTTEHVDEMARCKADIYYFAERYYKLVHQDYGLHQIKIRDYQKRIIDNFQNRFSITIAPRQCGKCILRHSNITIRNKKTGEIKEITIGEYYKMIQKSDNSEIINKGIFTKTMKKVRLKWNTIVRTVMKIFHTNK